MCFTLGWRRTRRRSRLGRMRDAERRRAHPAGCWRMLSRSTRFPPKGVPKQSFGTRDANRAHVLYAWKAGPQTPPPGKRSFPPKGMTKRSFVTRNANGLARSFWKGVAISSEGRASGLRLRALRWSLAKPVALLAAAVAAACLIGCVHYAPEPLSPESSAAALQERKLGGGAWGLARLTEEALRRHTRMWR